MRHITLTGLVALATVGLLAAFPCSVQAGPKAVGLDLDRPLFVTMVTPSRNRHVLPDLADPGLNNAITVRFSTLVVKRDLVEDPSFTSALSRKCEFLDHTRAAVHASASVHRNVLTIDPFDVFHQVLAQGRYTLTLKPTIRSARGRLLNDGAAAFRTTFYVGSRTAFAPVLMRISPAEGQTSVGLRRAVVATFDAPIDPASAPAAVRLEDRSTSPPTPIPAQVRLARSGFDVVVTPDAPGYPPNADVTLVIAGQGTATAASAPVLTEASGSKFTRDRGPRWSADSTVPTLFHSRSGDFDAVSGEFTLTFRTRASARAVRR